MSTHTLPQKFTPEEAARLASVGLDVRFAEGVQVQPLPDMRGAGKAAQDLIPKHAALIDIASSYPQMALAISGRSDLSEQGKKDALAKLWAAVEADLASRVSTAGGRITLTTLRAELERLAITPPADAWRQAQVRDAYIQLSEADDVELELADALLAKDALTLQAIILAPRVFHLCTDDQRETITAQLFRVLNPDLTEDADRLENVIVTIERGVKNVHDAVEHQKAKWGSADGPYKGYAK